MSLSNILLNASQTDSLSIMHRIDRCFDTVIGNISETTEMFSGIFFIDTANNIAAFCVLFYLGYEMWPVILGQKTPDILKLVRPMLILVIIASWPKFYMNFDQAKKNLADRPKAMYNAAKGDLLATEKRMDEKIAKVDSLTNFLFEQSMTDFFNKNINEKRSNGEGGRASSTGGSGYTGGGSGGGVRGQNDDNVSEPVEEIVIDDEAFNGDGHHSSYWSSAYAALTLLEYKASRLLEYIIGIIATIILQCYICGIMLISELGTTFVGMFGPIFFALSLTNVFKNHWARWIEKFFCYAFYPFIAYLIMTFLTFIIIHEMNIQTNMITIDKFEDFRAFMSVSKIHFGLLINYFIVLFVGSYCMHAVPELANNIMPGKTGASGETATGAGQFLAGVTFAIAGAAAKTVTKTATTMAASGVAASGVGAAAAVNVLKGNGKNDSDTLDNGHEKRNHHVHDGSKDQKTKDTSNSIDSYSKYNPFRLFFGLAAKHEEENDENFEYKRGGKNSSHAPKYNPSTNTHHVKRREYIKRDNWTSRNLSLHKLAQKTRNLNSSALQIINFILSTEKDYDTQPWAGAMQNTIQGSKRGVRTILSSPSIFAYHYKKHSNNGTYKTVMAWQRERNSDIVFVRKPSVGGYAYQTYGEDAMTMARLTGQKVRYLKVGSQKIPTFTLGKHTLQPVIHRLNEIGMSVNVINNVGKSIYYKEEIPYSKKENLQKIKSLLKKNGGALKFHDSLENFKLELSNGWDKNRQNNLTVDIKGILTDIYGALHMAVIDERGNAHTLYLDRLTENEIQNLADIIEDMKLRQKGFSFESPIPIDDEPVFDDKSFSRAESQVYEQKAASSSNNNTNDIIDNQASGQASANDNASTTNQKELDPFRELAAEVAWTNASSLSRFKKAIKHGSTFITTLIGGGTLIVLNRFRWGRATVAKAQKASDNISSFFGWNDKTRADIQKDIRAGIEYRWHLRTAVKDNIDFRQRPRTLPITVSLQRKKHQIITRGRGIHFANVDFRNRTALQKTAETGWRFTKWTARTAFGITRDVLRVATGQRPKHGFTSISKAGYTITKTGFKATYNSIRWVARKATARKAVIAWKRENRHNYAIVKRYGVRGAFFQTYGEDAMTIARILHRQNQIRVLHIGQGESYANQRFFAKNAVPSLILTPDDIRKLNIIAQKQGLSVDVINTRGHSLVSKNNRLAQQLGFHPLPDMNKPEQQS